MDLVSVIIPIYNVEKYVEQAILSICNQTYDNLEIIIIDDCSTDNTYYIANHLAKNDARIKLYRNTKNLKLVQTLNKALAYATGKYIVRMDGDDISVHNRIEKMITYLKNNPECKLLGTQSITINENGQEISEYILPTNKITIKKICTYISPVSHIWICEKKLYDELNGYRDIIGAEDYDFILRTISKGYLVENLPDKLYKIRIRQGNTISTIGLKQEISHSYCIKLYRERLSRTDNNDSYDINYLLFKFKLAEIEQNKFKNDYSIFKKGFNLMKNKKYYGIYYILISLAKSQYIRSYLKNRFMYRIIMKLVKLKGLEK